jgi:hypothetical protein
MQLCDYGCGQEAKHQQTSGKWCCCKHYSQCPENKRKNSMGNFGKKYKINMVKRLKDKYPIFFEVEETRYNPLNEIQVRCKNSKCKNSNEGWFTPTKNQLGERLRSLKTGNENAFFLLFPNL